MAKDFALSGSSLRGSGIKWDLRKEMPYSIYNGLILKYLFQRLVTLMEDIDFVLKK